MSAWSVYYISVEKNRNPLLTSLFRHTAVNFIRHTFAYHMPVLGVFVAILLHSFPIKGERLQKLEVELLKMKEQDENGITGPADKANGKVSPST